MKPSCPQTVKFLKLKRRLKLAHWQAVGLLESLWLIAQHSAQQGDIGKLSNEDLAASMEWAGDADELVQVFVDCGFLDRCRVHRLVVHGWNEHAPTWTRGNLAKAGLSIVVAVAVTPKDGPKDGPKDTPKDDPTDEPWDGPEPTVDSPTSPVLSSPNESCPKISRFTPPTEEEVEQFVDENNLNLDPVQFVSFYASKGWKVGSAKMKDWKAAARGWARRNGPKKSRILTEEELANWSPYGD